MKSFVIPSLLLFFMSTAYAVDLKICYESPHFFPYNEDGTSKQELSPVIKVLTDAGQKIGMSVKFIRTSWARCLEDIEHNKVDAILTSLWTKERDKFAIFPKTSSGDLNTNLHLLEAKYKIYTHIHSNLSWDGKKILNAQTGIGAPKDYVANDILKKMNVLKETDIRVRQAFDLIKKKRLDGYVALQNVGDIILNKYPDKKIIKKLDKDFITDFLFVPVSYKFYKEHPLETQIFFEEIANGRKNLLEGKL